MLTAVAVCRPWSLEQADLRTVVSKIGLFLIFGPKNKSSFNVPAKRLNVVLKISSK